MIKIKDIFDFLCELAPLDTQADFDNAGFMMGHAENEVRRVLLALDVTDEVADEAITEGAELIISHHPLIWKPLKSISSSEPVQNRILKLAENKIAVISMHTNLDAAKGGVNDVLMSLFEISPDDTICDGCGRIGSFENEISLERFLELCRDKLKGNGLRYYDSGRPVRRLAVLGGSGGSCIREAYEKGCDSYLTADIGYHQFMEAAELGINVIDGDHFCTENPMIPVLAGRLKKSFPDVEFVVSKCHRQYISFA